MAAQTTEDRGMRILRLDLGPGPSIVDLHPLVTVVQGVTPSERIELVDAARALARGATGGLRGLVQHQGLLLELAGSGIDRELANTGAELVIDCDRAFEGPARSTPSGLDALRVRFQHHRARVSTADDRVKALLTSVGEADQVAAAARVAQETAARAARPVILGSTEDRRLGELSRGERTLTAAERRERDRLLGAVGVTSWSAYVEYRARPTVAPVRIERAALTQRARSEAERRLGELRDRLRSMPAGAELLAEVEAIRAETEAQLGPMALNDLGSVLGTASRPAVAPPGLDDVLDLIGPVAVQAELEAGGSVPLVVVGALAALDDDEVLHLMTELETIACRLQIIVVSEHPTAASWASRAGLERAFVVNPKRPVAGRR